MDPYVSIAVSDPMPLPLAGWTVHAGFPSPAEDHQEGGLDLSRKFVRNPTTSFIVRATGESLVGLGIRPGDFLLVDRSRHPRDGEPFGRIAVVFGSPGSQDSVCRLRIFRSKYLLADDPSTPRLQRYLGRPFGTAGAARISDLKCRIGGLHPSNFRP